MSVKKISEQRLDDWVNELIEESPVLGVQQKDDHFEWDNLARASDLRLDYDVSLTPPGKVAFQPPRETLMRFDGVEYEPVWRDEPFTLFGVHPYDMVAINQMDEIFSMNKCDDHYLTPRESATIVACDVQTPSDDVFAGYLDNHRVEEGFDVLLTKLADGYLVDIRTEKGEQLAESLSEEPEASEADLEARRQVWEDNEDKLKQHELRAMPDEWPDLLREGHEHPVWKDMAEKCFSCGSCNTSCPTCYCFDVQEDVDWDLESGERARVWDGCLLEKFARVAGDHNFRGEKHERYRHRYYRKGLYVPDMIGECACVGCGRCINVCVSNIANPVEVFNRLSEEE